MQMSCCRHRHLIFHYATSIYASHGSKLQLIWLRVLCNWVRCSFINLRSFGAIPFSSGLISPSRGGNYVLLFKGSSAVQREIGALTWGDRAAKPCPRTPTEKQAKPSVRTRTSGSANAKSELNFGRFLNLRRLEFTSPLPRLLKLAGHSVSLRRRWVSQPRELAKPKGVGWGDLPGINITNWSVLILSAVNSNS